MTDDFLSTTPPQPSHLYETRPFFTQETVSWKVHNVSTLLKNQAWTSVSIPMEVALGVTEVTSWNISLMARNKNKVLCARTMLIAPQEQHRRVTHHLKVAVVEGGGGEEEEGPVYHFPTSPTTTNPANSNNPTNVTNRNANFTNSSDGDGGRGRNDEVTTGCMRRALRRFFMKNAKLDGVDDEMIGDGRLTKEARPAHKAPLCLWKIIPIDRIRPGEDDCIELRVTLTVLGCDVEQKRL